MERCDSSSKNPIRILHVVGSLGLGGIQSYLMNLYRNVNRNVIQFDFIVHIKTECSYEKEIFNLGGRVYYLPQDSFEKKRTLAYLKFWKCFFKTHSEYKIVHGHLRSMAFIYLAYARLNNRIAIAHSHAIDNGAGVSGIIKNILQFPIRYLANYYMGCSKQAVSWMFGVKRANSNKCKVLFNGIEASKYKFNNEIRVSIRKSFGIPENALVIGSVGRLVSQKNHKYLIKIYRELIKLNKKAWLIIVGDGPLFDSIRQESKGLNNVLLLGARTDIPQLLQGFDVFVLPSIKEGLGIAAIEAQAAGLPTIVSDILPHEAFITPLISNKSLLDSPEKWAKTIDQLVNIKREDTTHLIKESGYDIKSTVTWLTNFYTDISNNN